MTLAQLVEQKVEKALAGLGESGKKAQEAWDNIKQRGEDVIVAGTDKENRPKHVTLQALREAAATALLKEGRLRAATLIIHTPLPATPCRTNGKITEGLVADEVAQDPDRLKTVTTRANIIRDFLEAGGRVVVAFSQDEFKEAVARAEINDPNDKRPKVTKESMKIFTDLQAAYPNNFVIKSTSLPLQDRHSGATLFVEGLDGEESLYSIRAYQANAPKDGRDWGSWSGDPRKVETVADRLVIVNNFLEVQWGIDLRHELELSRAFLAGRAQGQQESREAAIAEVNELKQHATPAPVLQAPAARVPTTERGGSEVLSDNETKISSPKDIGSR